MNRIPSGINFALNDLQASARKQYRIEREYDIAASTIAAVKRILNDIHLPLCCCNAPLDFEDADNELFFLFCGCKDDVIKDLFFGDVEDVELYEKMLSGWDHRRLYVMAHDPVLAYRLRTSRFRCPTFRRYFRHDRYLLVADRLREAWGAKRAKAE